MKQKTGGAPDRRSIPVDRGLFLIRYDSCADEASPPLVTISSETAGDHQVMIITDPDAAYGTLARPGDCLAVRALQHGVVRVELTPSVSRGSVDATIKLERLRNGGAVKTKVPSRTEKPSRPEASVRAEAAMDGFEVIGHVARLGDVSVGAGEWLAGPSAPSQIEGVSILWPGKPDGVTLNYTVEMGGRGHSSTQAAKLGQYAGTKGRSLSLVGLTLALDGQKASDYDLTAEGLFLGSPPVRRQGTTVVLKSTGGREPLVGLKIGIEKKAARLSGAGRQVPSAPAKNGMRVFRGRSQLPHGGAVQREG